MKRHEAEGWDKDDPRIFTYTGAWIYLLRPTVNMVKIEDIAHALSQICRYGGHSLSHYSVAEHSVLVSKGLEHEGFSNKISLAGLLHDASEAYLGDVVSPLKSLLPGYKALYSAFDNVIANKFGVDYRLYPEVKKMDIEVGIMERNCPSIRRNTLRNHHLDIYEISMKSPGDAKALFLERFNGLHSN